MARFWVQGSVPSRKGQGGPDDFAARYFIAAGRAAKPGAAAFLQNWSGWRNSSFLYPFACTPLLAMPPIIHNSTGKMKTIRQPRQAVAHSGVLPMYATYLHRGPSNEELDPVVRGGRNMLDGVLRRGAGATTNI
jgi:hypothetical protein